MLPRKSENKSDIIRCLLRTTETRTFSCIHSGNILRDKIRDESIRNIREIQDERQARMDDGR